MKGKLWYSKGKWRLYFPPGIYRQRVSMDSERPPLDLERFLNRLRHEVDEKTFDERDWQKDKPLGFANLAEHWLEVRKNEVRCYRNLKNHMGKAKHYFGSKNIKTISFSELEDFHLSLPEGLSGKTKKNIFTTLHAFWQWVVDREEDKPQPVRMPKFPKIKYELKRRKTVTREQQLKILDWLKENSPYRVWLGTHLLIRYPAIRPGEMRLIKEKQLDLNNAGIYVDLTKTGKFKFVPIRNEDVDLLKSMPRSLPHLYFLRHEQGQYKGQQFGPDYLYTCCRKACAALDIRGTSLYAICTHSTARFWRLCGRTPEEIKGGLMRLTTESFNRYFEHELEDLRDIYGTGQVVEMEAKEGD